MALPGAGPIGAPPATTSPSATPSTSRTSMAPLPAEWSGRPHPIGAPQVPHAQLTPNTSPRRRSHPSSGPALPHATVATCRIRPCRHRVQSQCGARGPHRAPAAASEQGRRRHNRTAGGLLLRRVPCGAPTRRSRARLLEATSRSRRSRPRPARLRRAAYCVVSCACTTQSGAGARGRPNRPAVCPQFGRATPGITPRTSSSSASRSRPTGLSPISGAAHPGGTRYGVSPRLRGAPLFFSFSMSCKAPAHLPPHRAKCWVWGGVYVRARHACSFS